MISASIVLFNEDFETLNKTVQSFLNCSFEKKLYLIDNSPVNILESYFNQPEIEYIFIGQNIGFGKAHNSVIDRIKSDFHLVLNPDVEFSDEVIQNLIVQLNKNLEVAFITPKVIYPNGDLQYICRKHPTFFDLINRRIKISKKLIHINEYRDNKLNQSFYPDFIHGCFMLFRTKDFIDLKGFDSRYFLYMEDADICRKVDEMGKLKMYYPKESIVHLHQKGSSKSITLFFYHVSSALKYFLKWGF